MIAPEAPVSMSSISERIIKKIPGSIPPPTPREREGYIDDLSKRSVPVLQELLERQTKILTNKFLVNKLKDKGARAAELRDRIEKELKARDDIDRTAGLLSQMSLNQLNELEWTGHCSPGQRTKPRTNISEDDIEKDETDPLKILATHSGVTAHTKQIRVLELEHSLIKPEDLVDTNGYENNNVSQESAKSDNATQSDLQFFSKQSQSSTSVLPLDEPEAYAHFICHRFGHKEGKERFKPNKPLKTFTGEFPIKPPGRVSLKPVRWEETNVTPPVAIHEDAKLLSLEESLNLQREQARKLKEVQAAHAAAKLASQGISMGGPLTAALCASMTYRGRANSSSESEDEGRGGEFEEHEEHDDDQRDTDTAVVYNIVS